MNGGYASGAGTPLSESFQDSAFVNFINEADMHSNDTQLANAHPGKRASNDQQHKPARKTGGTKQVGHAKASHTASQTGEGDSTGSRGKPTGSNTSAPADDENWDELDNLLLDSQTMRQLIETEEEFYATQQFMMTAEPALSQEFAEPPTEAQARTNTRSASADGVQDVRNPRAVPSPAPQSVPVTPTAAQSIYVSDSDSAQSNRGAASGSFAAQNRYPQSRGALTRVSSALGPEQPEMRRTNLFPRLAPHIPPRPPALLNSRQRPLSGSSEIRFDLSTSILSSPGGTRQTPVTPTAPAPRAFAGASPRQLDSMAEEIRRLKEENTRVQAEFEAMRSRLYTKEGEVKIVRENLARTEIENTQLQERLASQISTAAAEQKQSEQSLHSEIERLRTELLFHQHESKTATIAQTPARSAASTPWSSSVRRTDGAHSLSTSSSAYPNGDDFMATPSRTFTRSTLGSSPATKTPKFQQQLQQQPQQQPQRAKRDRSVSTDDTQSPETVAPLIDILTGISKLPGTEFGSLMLLAVRLSKTVRNPASIQEFHDFACTTVRRVSSTGSYEQLVAVLQLLLQAVDQLPELRNMWLLDKSGSSGIADSGLRRLGQLSAVVCEALQANMAAAAQTRRTSRQSAMCGRAIAAHTRLLIRLTELQPAAALDSEVWAEFDPCLLARHLAPGLHLRGLSGVLQLLAVLIQVSPRIWSRMRDTPAQFEELLLAVVKRLRLAFATHERQMLDGQRKLLVLIASVVVKHEEDSKLLINTMRRFTRALVDWFVDEHSALTSGHDAPADDRRVEVLCEHMKCLNVILSEVDDVVALLDGDISPQFFAFVAATTRISFGEAPFSASSTICELAADLLAYVVTEDQAAAIQALAELS
ncbi:hypothetical protein H4S02_000437 [Coemansia sp. RSA 2611]|nr:hypothetical protein H4S02_000437 [Coemansia sp. RSA 2611]